jgi:GntR family transcriptional regulator, carbon starvation induced regulator
VSASPESPQREAPARETATDRLERKLRDDIVTGRLEPGMRIKPSLLSADYGVSVTPFREVLARLESDGLIVVDRWVGASVAPISAEDCEDMFRLRKLIECEAIRDSIADGDVAWRRHLESRARALAKASDQAPGSHGSTRRRTLRWLTVHREFHAATVAACRSPWMLSILENLYDHLDRYQAKAWTQGGLRAPSLVEHQAILAACLEGDKDGAAEALALHLESAMTFITGVIRASQPDERSSIEAAAG